MMVILGWNRLTNQIDPQQKQSETLNKKDTEWLKKIESQKHHDIRGMGKQVWRPGARQIVCKGCIYMGEPLKSEEIRGNGFSTYIAKCETPVCNKPNNIHIVKWPYEMCKDRLEKPKVPIDRW